MKTTTLVVLFVLLLSSVAFAQFPKYSGWVNDFAGVIQPEYKEAMNNYINNLEKNTTAEIAVVTVQTIEGYTPKEYATQLFKTWGIGKKDKDNGLLILLVLKDRRIEVETGYGLEGILPDSKVGRILDEKVAPYLKAGNYSAGLYAGVVAFGDVIQKGGAEIVAEKGDRGVSIAVIVIILFIVIVFIIFALIFFKLGIMRCPQDNTVMNVQSTRREVVPTSFIGPGQTFVITTYVCPKCGYAKEIRRSITRPKAVMGRGGGSGAPFSFGGGGSGGGGAGRSF